MKKMLLIVLLCQSYIFAGLKAEYFDNVNFTAPKLTRIEGIDFNWGKGTPDIAIAPDTFSVRWEGFIEPEFSENYTFYTISDDGVRLWINNQLLIDNWTTHKATENKGSIDLIAGQKYSIKMEYFEQGSGALIKLLWSSSSRTKQIIPETRLSAAITTAVITPTTLLTGIVPYTIFTHALASAGAPLTNRYEWDFGDPIGEYNKLIGFNVAHTYNAPGIYTITLSVTDETGNVNNATVSVNIAESTRSMIYVDSNGNDLAPGTAPETALKTVAKAQAFISSNRAILFKRGGEYQLSQMLLLSAADLKPVNNLLIGAYGVGAKPILKWIGDLPNKTIIGTNFGRDIVIEGLTFDSKYANTTGKSNTPYAINTSGSKITIRDCEFLNVNYAISAVGLESGLLVQNNSAPNVTGLRAYFVWKQGNDIVILGNMVANSTREFIIRGNSYNRVLIAHNDLTDMDRRSIDSGDLANSVIAAQAGQYIYIARNRLSGATFGVGPVYSSMSSLARTRYAVIEHNTLVNSGFRFAHGAEDAVFRDNVFNEVKEGDAAVYIDKYSPEAQRGVSRVIIEYNTVRSNRANTTFLRLWGEANSIKLLNNLVYFPKLIGGKVGGVVSKDGDLSSISASNENIYLFAPAALASAFEINGLRMNVTSWNARGKGIDYTLSAIDLNGEQYTTEGITAGARLNRK